MITAQLLWHFSHYFRTKFKNSMNLSCFKIMLDFQQIKIHFLKSSSKAIFDIQGRIKVFSNSHPGN